MGWSRGQILKHALRPRVLIYSAILIAVTVAIAASLMTRSPLRFDVIRDRGAIARMVEKGQIENVYRLNLMNASESEMSVQVAVSGAPNIRVASETNYTIGATQTRSVAVRVRVPPLALKPGTYSIQFDVQILGEGRTIHEASTFIVPR